MSEVLRRSGTVRALIVDDSPGFRRELRALLELEEVAVVGEAANGWEAVELTEKLGPDVILMDQNMPALSGVGATRKIKSKHPGSRVIFVAAEGEWRDEALRAGADAYFVKGSELEALMRAIHDPMAVLRSRALPVPTKPTREIGPTLAIAAAGAAAFAMLAGLILAPSIALPGIAILFGICFFLYGLKYYGTNALILLATSGNGNGNGHANGSGHSNGNGKLLGRLRNGNGNGNGGSGLQGLGLNNGGNGRLHVQPFVSIHLPLYNESTVVDRLLTACTNLDYENYEVIVADDSTDETTELLMERWEPHPRVKISHRDDRSGFKGGALQVALEVTDPRSEFVAVFDADFLPPPDIIHQFLAYFYGINGNGNGHSNADRPNGEDGELRLIDDRVAVVQGYQWHILNASENWITKGIRAEFSGSYVVERAGQELLGAMKMISGSVFMIRTDVLRTHGWGTSITEDWELTLRLYLEGYKVLYTPFIQAPSECVANFKQLARQRMRWAEGHTFNVKQYFWEVLSSDKLNRAEKREFVYYAPYYLQSVLFMLGTGAWMLSELIFKFALPFWTETLGWALVFANAGSLVLMNLTGLFLERGIQRNWAGLFSFALLSYLLVPYQAWAAIKGLLEPHEGGWHRTQKTGVITEAVDRMQLKKRMRKLLPKKKRRSRGPARGSPATALLGRLPKPLAGLSIRRRLGSRLTSGVLIGCLILALISSSLGTLKAETPHQAAVPLLALLLPFLLSFTRKGRWLAGQLISLLLAIAFAIAALAGDVEQVTAAPDTFYFHNTSTTGITPAGEYMNNIEGTAGSTTTFDTTGQNEYWYADQTWPTGNDDASIAAGSYTANLYFNSLPSTQVPAVDAVSTGRSGVSSITVSHTTSGTDRLMLVGVSINNDDSETVSSVTYNGTSLSLVGTAATSDDARIEIWSLVAPATGTHDVVVSFSATLSRNAVVGVATFNDVHQTTPLGTFAGNSGTGNSASVSVSSASGEVVFDTVACETCTSLTAGNKQTERWNVSEGATSIIGAGSTADGKPNVNMTWSLGSADHWATGGVPIKPSGGSAPTVDAVSTATSGTNSMTISHTTSGKQRLMLVGVSLIPNQNETVTSVTYNGDPLTLVGTATQSNDARIEIWQLVPPDGGTHDVVINFSANLWMGAVAGVSTFTGVDQTTPLGTFASNSGTSAGPATVDVTSATNELVFDTVNCESCSSLTVGAGQTERWNLTHATNFGAGSTELGAATVTMSWSLGASDDWAIGAVPIKPAAASVDIQLTVSHTASDGSGATTIVTSPVTTIDASTTDPLALDLGSGASQTFTSADPRRLRLQVNVVSTSGGGSFVLDYDGACASSLCSNLDTPVVTVPEYGLLLLPAAVLLPVLVSRHFRRRAKSGRSRHTARSEQHAPPPLDVSTRPARPGKGPQDAE